MAAQFHHQLQSLSAPKDADVDIVAIHGLAAERPGFTTEQTWTCHDKLWLRDFLPSRLPRARILLFGYDSDQAFKASINGVRSRAEGLLDLLRSIRKTQEDRPLIFISHSLGGLVVKQALTLAKLDDVYVKIQKSTYAIIFFGTPHRRTHVESLGMIAARVAKCSTSRRGRKITAAERSLTESLMTDQLFADDITETFNACLTDYRIVDCCETVEYPHMGLIVPEASSTLGLSAQREAVYHIDSDHYHMCKFKDADQHSYRLVEQIILDLTESAVVENQSHISQETSKQLELSRISAKFSTYFLVPYKRNPHFTGREKMIEHIAQSLSTVKGSQCQCIVLLGVGGIGKSSIALEYVYQLRDVRPRHSVFWVRAASHERFFQTYLQILQREDMAEANNQYKNKIGTIKDWLARDDIGSWTIVIDDIEDIGFCVETKNRLARFVPDCSHGSLIFVTRSQSLSDELSKRVATVLIKVTALSANESVRMMTTCLGRVEEPNQLNKLISLLGHSPLAMTQAAGCIRSGGSGVREYVSRLEASLAAGKADFPDNVISVTLAAARDQLIQSDVNALDLLSLAAFYDSHAIPVSVFGMFLKGPSAVAKSLKILESYSLVEYNVSDEFIDVHELVRSVARGWLIQHGKDGEWILQALASLLSLCPEGESLDLGVCTMLLPHILSVVEYSRIPVADTVKRSDLLSNAGMYLRSQGRWEKAMQMEIGALEMKERLLGAQDSSTLISMANLASLYSNTGRWYEARELQVKLVHVSEQKLGAEHPETLKRLAGLALTCKFQGRWQEAQEMEEKVLKSYTRLFGQENPRTWTSMANLAFTYSLQGELEKAEATAVPATNAIKKALGARHPDTLHSMADLASILAAQGKFTEADELERSILATSREVLGPEHPDTLSSMSNLALILSKQGRWHEAELLEEKVLEASLTMLGVDHPDTLTTMHNLASTHLNQGRLEDAEKLQTQVAEKRVKIQGTEHPDTLSSKGNLALVYKSQGRWEEAEELEEQVVGISQRVFGAEHPFTLKILRNLAATYEKQDRHSEAIALMEKVVELRLKRLGPNHPDTVDSVQQLEDWVMTYRPRTDSFVSINK